LITNNRFVCNHRRKTVIVALVYTHREELVINDVTTHSDPWPGASLYARYVRF